MRADQHQVTIADRGQLVLPGVHTVPDDLRNALQFCTFNIDSATCTLSELMYPFAPITVWLGEGDDAATLTDNSTGSAFGGEGADRLVGSSWDNRLSGGPGPDVIDAGPGRDSVDRGLGSSPNQAMSAGADVLRLGPGRDLARAPDDGDEVHARDGEADVISCFGSNARVIADSVDTLNDCPNAEVE